MPISTNKMLMAAKFCGCSPNGLPTSAKFLPIEAKFCGCPHNGYRRPPNFCRLRQIFADFHKTDAEVHKADVDNGKFLPVSTKSVSKPAKRMQSSGQRMSKALKPIPIYAKRKPKMVGVINHPL